MRALRVAQVLAYSEMMRYRFRKSSVLTDLLILFSSLPAFAFPSASAHLIAGVIEHINTFGVENVKILVSSLIASLIFLISAVNSGRVVVSREQFAVFTYPVSLGDFLIGRLISSLLDFLRFSPPLLAALYSLSIVYGKPYTVFLAYTTILLGHIYLSAISTTLTMLGIRTAMVSIAFLSLFDIALGRPVISYFTYVFVDALHSTLTSPRLTLPALLSAISVILMAVVSERVRVDIESPDFTPRVKVRSEKDMRWTKKPLVELWRMKVLYIPLLAVPSYLTSRLISPHIPSGLPDYFAAYLLFPIMSFMSYLSWHDSSSLWFYRVSNSVDVFARTAVLKNSLGGFSLLIPCAAFLIPITSDPMWIYTSFLSIPFIASATAVLAIRDFPKVRKSVRLAHMPENTRGIGIGLLHIVVLSLTITAIHLTTILFGPYSALLLLLLIPSIRAVRFAAERGEVG